MTLRWMVTGSGGMVGQDVVAALERAGEAVSSFDRSTLDITDQKRVLDIVRRERPSVIVNCSAYTAVDDAESREADAERINGMGVRNLAEAATQSGALLTQISTDFVFDGRRQVPYETAERTSPLSAYGRTKLKGEESAALSPMHLIVRTSWLFGTGGNNFVEAITRQIGGGRETLRVVDDQRGRPTYTPHLAEALIELSRMGVQSADARGIFHYADAPEASWFDFASAIVKEMKRSGRLTREVALEPVPTATFPRAAIRPAYSVLSTRRYEQVTGLEPSSWEEGLTEYMSVKRAG